MTAFEDLEPDWISPEEAVRRILEHAVPLPLESAPLSEVLGRALAEPAVATATLPPWDNSAMDGYAVRASDTAGASESSPVRLPVTGEARPGPRVEWSLSSGTAARIMTGSPIPPGADAVVRVEDTNRAEVGSEVEIRVEATEGRDVRGRGEDVREGEVVLDPGVEIGPGQVGVLAALGMDHVPVRRRPRVGILTSGDEIVPPSSYEKVRAGQAIPDSAGWALQAATVAAGGVPVPLGTASDDAESIRERVRAGGECDLLVTIGGASMGAGDLFKRTLLADGFSLVFWRALIRPGSPTSFGLMPRGDGAASDAPPLPVFGLPGNPASAFVTFHLFVRPFLRAVSGHRIVDLPTVRANASQIMRSPKHLTQYVRVVLERSDGDLVASLTGSQSSGLVRSLGLADGFAIVPVGTGGIEAGDPVDVILLSGPPELGTLLGDR